jgi:hypothetical protein
MFSSWSRQDRSEAWKEADDRAREVGRIENLKSKANEMIVVVLSRDDARPLIFSSNQHKASQLSNASTLLSTKYQRKVKGKE